MRDTLKSLGRPRKTESRDTRQAILDAALDLFSSAGYAATSMRQIARAVGVRESAIYVHFKGKAEILETLFETYGPSGAAFQLNKVDPQVVLADPIAFFKAFFAEMTSRWDDTVERKFMRLVVLEGMCSSDSGNALARDGVLRVRKAIFRLLRALIDAGRLADVKEEWLFFKLLGPLLLTRHECMLQIHQKPDMKNLQEFVNFHVESFFSEFLLKETK